MEGTCENDFKNNDKTAAFQKIIEDECKRMTTGIRVGNIHILNQLKAFKRVPE